MYMYIQADTNNDEYFHLRTPEILTWSTNEFESGLIARYRIDSWHGFQRCCRLRRCSCIRDDLSSVPADAALATTLLHQGPKSFNWRHDLALGTYNI